jgi:hypothetical protein
MRINWVKEMLSVRNVNSYVMMVNVFSTTHSNAIRVQRTLNVNIAKNVTSILKIINAGERVKYVVERVGNVSRAKSMNNINWIVN